MATELNANKLTVNELSANNIYSYSGGTDAQWTQAYTTIQSNSANNWDNNLVKSYVHTNFLALSDYTNLTYKFDYVYSSPEVSYTGVAKIGTSESSSLWTITKITYVTTGEVLSSGRAFNVDWTTRTNHTYTLI